MLSDMVRQDLKGCAEKMVETFLCWKTIRIVDSMEM
jgi:hypothetical protein